jgi:hypothetical protein
MKAKCVSAVATKENSRNPSQDTKFVNLQVNIQIAPPMFLCRSANDRAAADTPFSRWSSG